MPYCFSGLFQNWDCRHTTTLCAFHLLQEHWQRCNQLCRNLCQAQCLSVAKGNKNKELPFESLVALIFTPVTILLLSLWVICINNSSPISYIKGLSNIHVLSCKRCYRLQPLMTTLIFLTSSPCNFVNIIFFILQVYVLKRPHVDEFLKRMGELFECVLFTASLAKV